MIKHVLKFKIRFIHLDSAEMSERENQIGGVRKECLVTIKIKEECFSTPSFITTAVVP